MTEPPPPAPERAPALSGTRAFLARSLLTYGTSAVVALLSLVNVLVVARVLGPAGRGGVAFLITVSYLSAQFASLGIQQANSNIGGSEPGARPSLATNSLLLAAALGVLAVGVLVALVAAVPAVGAHSAPVPRAIAFVVIPPIIFGDYLVSLLTANYRFGVVNVAGLTQPALQLGLNGALTLAGALSVTWAVAAWAAGQLAATAVVTAATVRGDGFGPPARALARRMVVFGLQTHGGRMLNFGNYRLDQWLVGSIAGERQLGLYSVAVAWSEGLFLLPNAIAGAQRPDLVRATPEAARRRALRAHWVVQGVTVLLAAGLLLLAHPLTVGVFGSDFGGAVEQLRILAFGGFGIVALKQLGDALIAQRHPLLESVAVATAFICTLALDAILIPQHGGVGAATASTIAYSLGGIAAGVLFVRTIGGARRRCGSSTSAV